VADFLEHFAQFAVAAFNQNNFVPGIVSLAHLADAGRRGADTVGAGLAALDGDACAKYVEFRLAGNAGDLDQVGFFHAGGGAGKAVGEFAVVGYQQQAFAHIVEAANGVKALPHFLKELHHRGAALGILDGGDESAGLVEDEVAQPLGTLQQFAVHAYVVAGGVRLGASLGHYFSVHLNAALLDKLLGLAAAGYAGLGKDFLEAIELGGRTRFGIELGLGFVLQLAFGLRFGFQFIFQFIFQLGFQFGFVLQFIFEFTVSQTVDG